ncbi:MAG: 3-beta-hydroxy-Delta(5)-steroid dehydrogenase [Micavibrio sp.]|nr:MAG: 3-beta-hydroxy-Delta(5)-steroid dehydrogenase [Micavibrio sp.]
MNGNNKIATVFGGTGFVGRQVVRELAQRGFIVKVATRVPESAYFLKPHGVVGQIVPFACNYKDEKSIKGAVAGADYVVNCIGILYERKKGDFARMHADIPAMIAGVCKKQKVKRLVHISIPNIEKDTSRYARTKLEGEKSILKVFPKASILRPSIVFGPDDNFFNKFAELIRFLPVLPLIGGGRTKFQPVYVGDVADAVMACLTGGEGVCGKVYELGGPEIVTFRQIYEILFSYTGRKRPFIVVPWAIAKIQAFFMGLFPNPLLTCDQVESLKTDYIVSEKAQGFEDLGVQPKAMGLILPRYLKHYRAGGRFAGAKCA